MLGSGRLSEADFARLTSRAKDGLIKRSDVGRFIAENLLKDPKSKVFGKDTAALLASDALQVGETIGSWLIRKLRKLFGFDEGPNTTHRDIEKKLTKLTGEDNLVGSAGEFGLLFAFLANKPDARQLDGEPAVAVQDLKAMFVDRHLPNGWEIWKKSRRDWVINTTALIISGGEEYRALKRTQ